MMAGPWEKYQRQTSSAPWERYASPQQPAPAPMPPTQPPQGGEQFVPIGGGGLPPSEDPSLMGKAEAFGRGGRHGLMINADDEVAGLNAASGLPDWMRASPAGTIASLALGARNRMTEPVAEEVYQQAAGDVREKLAQAREDRPYWTAGGEVAGGITSLAVPGGGAVRGVSGAGRLARGTGAGTAGGFFAGFNEGDGDAIRRGYTGTIGALLGAGGGAAFEAASMAARPAARTLMDLGRRVTGRSPANPAREAAEAAGVPFTEEFARNFANRARHQGDGAATARQAAADEFGVPLTRGQATGELDDLAFEEASRRYGRGKEAGETLRGFDEAQQQAMQEAAGSFGERIGAGRVPPQRATQGAEEVIEAVRGKAGQLKADVRNAYEAPGVFDLSIAKESVRELPDMIRSQLDEADVLITNELTPSAAARLQNLEKFVNEVPRGKADDFGFRLKAIEKQRSALGKAISDAGQRPEDARALRAMKDSLDGWLDDAVDTALFSGDPAALDALKGARAIRARYGRMFEGKDDAGKFMQKLIRDDVTAQEAANWLWGSWSQVGARGSSSRVAKRLKNVLGPESEEWAGLRQATWLRLVNGETGEGLTPQKLASRLSQFTSGKGEALAKELFSPDELAAMQRFGKVAQMTVTPRGVTNPSGTGYEVSRAMRDAFSNIAGMLGVAEGGLGTGMMVQAAMRIAPGLRNRFRAGQQTGGRYYQQCFSPRGARASGGGLAIYGPSPE